MTYKDESTMTHKELMEFARQKTLEQLAKGPKDASDIRIIPTYERKDGRFVRVVNPLSMAR